MAIAAVTINYYMIHKVILSFFGRTTTPPPPPNLPPAPDSALHEERAEPFVSRPPFKGRLGTES